MLKQNSKSYIKVVNFNSSTRHKASPTTAVTLSLQLHGQGTYMITKHLGSLTGTSSL